MEARITEKILEIDLWNTAPEVVCKFPAFRFESFFCCPNKKKDFSFPNFFFSCNPTNISDLGSKGASKYI